MTRNAFTERLRQAGLTTEEFADVVQVDPKTVQRWVAGRIPQRRHRPKIARALDTPEDVLWPTDAPAPAPAPAPAGEGETRPRGDVIASWGWADDPAAPDPMEFLTGCEGPVDVMDSGGELLREDRVIATLIESASAQSPVRVLVDLPRHNLVPLIGVPHLELRVADRTGSCAIIRVGDRMLTYIDVPRDAVDEQRPLLELKLADDRGLFTRLALAVDMFWDQADDPIRTDEQLDTYLLDSPGIHEDDGDDDGPGEPEGAEDVPRTSDREPARTRDHGAAPPRRWPRRPDRS
jgi:transcriptional regulator with XRE-family HTH domain